MHSGTLVCMDRPGTIARGDLLARDGAIAALGADGPAALAALPGGRADESYDASGALVLPGLVHAHLHLCQTLFRGLAPQTDLLRWLREAIWPLEAALDAPAIAAAARAGLLELVRGGVTCVNDMGSVHHTDALGAVLEESGVRAVFGKALMDRADGAPARLLEPPDRALAEVGALAKRFHGAGEGRLRMSLAPRFILSCSERLWRDGTAFAAERGLVVHTHLAESPGEAREVKAAVGKSAARYFAQTGVLSNRFVGAHGVWLDEEELATLAGADAALAHCPGSNLKLGSGFARVRGWLDAGIRCGLGSDGAACNDRLDVFHEMSLAAGISRVHDPERPLESREVLELATRRGAEALGLGDVTGSLERGKAADAIVIRPDEPVVLEGRDPYGAVVHALRHHEVALTMVAGRALCKDGAWTTLDAERVRAEAVEQSRAVLARSGIAR